MTHWTVLWLLKPLINKCIVKINVIFLLDTVLVYNWLGVVIAVLTIPLLFTTDVSSAVIG